MSTVTNKCLAASKGLFTVLAQDVPHSQTPHSCTTTTRACRFWFGSLWYSDVSVVTGVRVYALAGMRENERITPPDARLNLRISCICRGSLLTRLWRRHKLAIFTDNVTNLESLAIAKAIAI
jgi:hypothetical protein